MDPIETVTVFVPVHFKFNTDHPAGAQAVDSLTYSDLVRIATEALVEDFGPEFEKQNARATWATFHPGAGVL